ncbi:MAG: 50S ribosomal protein L16 [Candidatus Dojkabacteria bacterium]|nr:50S ribosomal protein L16 [Candidatus Dojkabacteria bacterium]
MALQPKKRKYRKEFRGKMGGIASANNTISFGEYGLKAMDSAWIDSRQLEAARRAITGHIKRKGKVWIRVFPHKPYTNKPTNTKMIGGKGDIVGYVAVVQPGTIIFEIGGVGRKEAEEAMRLATHKLSVKTRFATKKDI